MKKLVSFLLVINAVLVVVGEVLNRLVFWKIVDVYTVVLSLVVAVMLFRSKSTDF